MVDTAEFDFVIKSAYRALDLQKQAAKRFSDTSDWRQPVLAEQLSSLIDQFEEAIQKCDCRLGSVEDDDEQKIALNEARSLLHQTRSLQERTRWLEFAAKPPIDLGSFYYLSSLAKRLIGPDCELTVVATHDGSYAMRPDFFLRGSSEESRLPLIALIPFRELRSGLLHPLLVHEIGHGVAHIVDLGNTLFRELLDDQVGKSLRDAANVIASKTKIDAAAIEEDLFECFQFWAEEIFCDAIALACLGVSYLFAFTAEVLPKELDKATRSHPPSRQRLRLIIERLRRLGWDDVVSNEVPGLVGWLNAAATAEPCSLGPGFDDLRNGIDATGPMIQEFAEEHVGGLLLRPDAGGLEEARLLLAENVPPAQLANGGAADRGTLIAACWLSALSKAEGSLAGIVQALDSPELGQLLPYALEMSVLVEKWESG